MKATRAELHYGASIYPTQEANLPELPIEIAIKQAIQRMSVLSGGHPLDSNPLVTFSVSGNGYFVEFKGEVEV